MIALVCVTVGMLLAVTIWAAYRTATSPGRGPQFDPDPTVWRVRGSMQDVLPPNCYTWAANRPAAGLLRPGDVGHHRDELLELITHQRAEDRGVANSRESFDRYVACIRARLERDGLLDTAKHREPPSLDAWVVVLYIDLSERYHFVRHDASGLWSHKKGALPAHRLWWQPTKVRVRSEQLNYENDTSWWVEPVRLESPTPHPVLPGSHTEYFLRVYAFAVVGPRRTVKTMQLLDSLMFHLGIGGWRPYKQMKKAERRYIADMFAAEAADPALKAEHDQVRRERVESHRRYHAHLAAVLEGDSQPIGPVTQAERTLTRLDVIRHDFMSMSAPVRMRDSGDNYDEWIQNRPAWLPDADEKAEIARMIHESLAFEPIRRPAPTLRFDSYYGFIVADPDIEWSIDIRSPEQILALDPHDWPKHPPKNDQQWSLTVSHVWNGVRRRSEGYWGLGFHGVETVWPDPDNQLERFLIDAAGRHGYRPEMQYFGALDRTPHLGGEHIPKSDWEATEYAKIEAEAGVLRADRHRRSVAEQKRWQAASGQPDSSDS